MFLTSRHMTSTEVQEAASKIAIHIPALSRPTLEDALREFPDLGINKIVRDTSSTKPLILKLQLIRLPGESEYSEGDHISPEQYDERTKSEQFSLVGFQHAKWIYDNQEGLYDFRALFPRIVVHFRGMVMSSTQCGQCSVDLSGGPIGHATFGGNWYFGLNWLGGRAYRSWEYVAYAVEE